jgi:hypothetical protein
MKGQFFVMTTVIMIYTLMTMIQYIYDFSDINLVQIKKMVEVEYIQYIKDVLNKTVFGSFVNQDCNKLDTDLTSTENFLTKETISRGVNLTIYHRITSCPVSLSVYFNFSLRTPELYTFTEFTESTSTPTCPNGICSASENCPADASACTDNMCYEPTCVNGCGQDAISAGGVDEACNAASGCVSPPCQCDGYGTCLSSSPPPSPPP